MELNSNQINLDELHIDTPELVDIEMPLAGIGSRFIALLVDSLIWFAGLLVLIVLLICSRRTSRHSQKIQRNGPSRSLFSSSFCFNWGYFTLFEAFWNGRTPGKRVARIRVIQRSGRAIGLFESMARNLVRYVDSAPLYAVGVIAMFATRQHQRLGDLAAGTLVVRDHEMESPLGRLGNRTFTGPSFEFGRFAPPHLSVVLPATSVAKLSAEDLMVWRVSFRAAWTWTCLPVPGPAERMGAALGAKSGLAIPEGVSVETFLEAIAHQLREVARMR